MTTENALEVKDLRVTFGHGEAAVHAVDGVSFTVAKGTTYGLVGESGCGKSTILRVLCGLNPHWSGTLRIAGEDIGPHRSRAQFKRAQMVFQDPYASLHPRHTVASTLMEPIQIHKLDRPGQRIDKVLTEVGLGPRFRFRYPHQLSGGQRQRVALARALILEPEILLLDEPTSALDVSVQAEVLNLLKEVRDIEGLTYLLVSHDLAVIAHMCDRLAVMTEGRLVEELAAGDLAADRIDHPYTRRLFAASAGYDRRLAASA